MGRRSEEGACGMMMCVEQLFEDFKHVGGQWSSVGLGVVPLLRQDQPSAPPCWRRKVRWLFLADIHQSGDRPIGADMIVRCKNFIQQSTSHRVSLLTVYDTQRKNSIHTIFFLAAFSTNPTQCRSLIPSMPTKSSPRDYPTRANSRQKSARRPPFAECL